MLVCLCDIRAHTITVQSLGRLDSKIRRAYYNAMSGTDCDDRFDHWYNSKMYAANLGR